MLFVIGSMLWSHCQDTMSSERPVTDDADFSEAWNLDPTSRMLSPCPGLLIVFARRYVIRAGRHVGDWNRVQ
jgi:hypothetical protein